MYFAYRQLAAKLGLFLSPQDPGILATTVGLYGEVDGHPIELVRYNGRNAHIRIKSPLTPQLDLGLGLSRAGVLARLSELVGVHDIRVGDPGFDKAFSIRGDEPSRVQALLAPPLRAFLSTIHGDWGVDDGEVTRTLGTSAEGVEVLEHALRECVQIARAIGEARKAVPPATALRAHHAAWSALASERGFAGEATPLWMSGQVGRSRVALQAFRRSATSYTFDISAELEKPAELRLDAQPQTDFLQNLGMPAAVPTGDAAFDSVFRVTTSQAPRVRELLDENVRGRLLALRKHGTVKLVHPSVVLSTSLDYTPPDAIPAHIESLCSLVEAVAANLSGPGVAYR